MPGIDRGTDVPDVAPDALRPEGVTPTASRGAVLADATVRRECALAYRVTVDAVLAVAAPDAGARPSSIFPTRVMTEYDQVVDRASQVSG